MNKIVLAIVCSMLPVAVSNNVRAQAAEQEKADYMRQCIVHPVTVEQARLTRLPVKDICESKHAAHYIYASVMYPAPPPQVIRSDQEQIEYMRQCVRDKTNIAQVPLTGTPVEKMCVWMGEAYAEGLPPEMPVKTFTCQQMQLRRLTGKIDAYDGARARVCQ